jgi:hypothetical protein
VTRAGRLRIRSMTFEISPIVPLGLRPMVIAPSPVPT